MPAPTLAELNRFTDLVAQGFEPSEASEAVWQAPADLPASKTKRPAVMVTEFPDGIVIGWDSCGSCHTAVSRCACKPGPAEPKVFAKWRADATTMPAYGRGKTATPVTAPSAAASTSAKPAGIVCREHGGATTEQDADKNDDGTWTCHACQEAGAQKVRT